jgi:hypothetical protein
MTARTRTIPPAEIIKIAESAFQILRIAPININPNPRMINLFFTTYLRRIKIMIIISILSIKIMVNNYLWHQEVTLNYGLCTLLGYGHGMELNTP